MFEFWKWTIKSLLSLTNDRTVLINQQLQIIERLNWHDQHFKCGEGKAFFYNVLSSNPMSI